MGSRSKHTRMHLARLRRDDARRDSEQLRDAKGREQFNAQAEHDDARPSRARRLFAAVLEHGAGVAIVAAISAATHVALEVARAHL